MKLVTQHSIYNKWRRCDDMATLFSTGGLIIAIIQFEQDVSEGQVSIDVRAGMDLSQINAMDSDKFNSWYNWVYKCTTFALTCTAILFLILRRKFKNQWIDSFVRQNFKDIMAYGPLQ